MSVFPNLRGTPSFRDRSGSILRRARRNRRQATLEMLETRVVPAFTFSVAGGVLTATQTPGTSDTSLIFAVSGGFIEYNLDGGDFTTTTLSNTAGNSVNVIEAAGASNGTITLGSTSAPVSPFSAFNVSFAISQAGALTSSSLVINDTAGTAAGTYSYDGTSFVTPSGITSTNTATQPGGVTIDGSPFNDTYNVLGTKTGEPLNIVSQGDADTVSLGDNGDVSNILGPVSVENTTGLSAMTIDASSDPNPHTDIVLQSTVAGTSTVTGLTGNTVTYATASLSALTIDTNASADETLNINFGGGGGNPIPTASQPGLVFNAGNPATGISHALNLYGQLPTGAFASETHNANDQTVLPQVGQYGSIDFVDAASTATSLDYTGLQPIDDTSPALDYTFNDDGYPDQSFLVQDGPSVMGSATLQFANTPTPPTPLNFETTNVANKTNVVFNALPLVAGTAGPGVNGVVNVATASTGLASLAFNIPDAGQNAVSFLALPAAVPTTYNGGGAQDVTSVAGKGVASGTTLTLNGGAAVNTLTYDAGGLVPTVAMIPGGLSITVAGAGTVDVLGYQAVNIIDVPAPTVTPTSSTISAVEGVHYTGIPVGSFTAPVPTIFSGLSTGALPVPTLPASAFTASINWGDPSPDLGAGTVTQNGVNPSVYYVTGTHTFLQSGSDLVTSTINFAGGSITYPYPVTLTTTPTATTTIPVTVSLNASNGTPITSSATATVTQGPLAITVFPVVGTEGTAIPSAPIATFTDAGGANPIADYSATISVVNSAGLVTMVPGATIAQVDGSAQYTVTAPAFTLTEEGTYQVLVAITDSSGSTPVTVTGASTATVADATLTAGAAVALTPHTGVLLSNAVVGSFTDANTTAPVSDYTGTIDWGDGTAPSLATFVATATPGVFDVDGTHAYAKPGDYATKVVVNDVGGSTVTIPGSATVTDPALSGTARSFTAQEGQGTGTIVLATIDNPNTLAGVSQLTATVNWGDSTTNFTVPVSLVGGTSTDSIFEVDGSHTYAEEGTFTVTVTVTTTGGATTAPTSPLTATATVVDAPLTAVGSASISGIEGSTTGPKAIATWTDANPGATVADYTAGGGSVVVDWGDGSSPVTLPASDITASGSPNGVVFTATAAHTFPEEGSYQVTTTISDDGGAMAVAHGTAVIADAALTAPSPQTPATKDIDTMTSPADGGTILAGLPFTAVVATFNDANPLATAADYTPVMISWGDGTESLGVVIQPGGPGTTFEVLGTHTYTSTKTTGTSEFDTVVTVQDVGGSALTINGSVLVAALPITLSGQLNAASDSGESNSDAITNVTQPNFFGTATVTQANGQVVPEAGAHVTLYATPLSGGSSFVIGQATTNSSGTWSITSTSPLAQGKYVVTATAVDASGNNPTSTTILPNATEGPLTIDTAGPKVTAVSFDRVDGQIDVTFQDNLSGLDQAEVINAANYQLTKLHTVRGTYVVNVISATPAGPTGPETVVLSINDGRQLRGGNYLFTIFSGGGATGIRDVAGNALDGEFYGYFPSGNNIPGGNFVAELNAVHHTIFPPRTIIGHATPVSPPGTPATGMTIPTANPQTPAGNPNFHGNPSQLKGERAHHKVKLVRTTERKAVVHKVDGSTPTTAVIQGTSTDAHDAALAELVNANID